MSQTFVAEQKLLENLHQSLAGYNFENPRAFKSYFLTPPFLGEANIFTRKGEGETSVIGLTYQPLRKKNFNETNIEGVIIDTLGVGYIKGVESYIDGFKGLKFLRYPVEWEGVDKKFMLKYECSSSEPDKDLCEGKIKGWRSGTFKIYTCDSADNMIMSLKEYHEQLEKYYDQCIQNLVK